MSESGDRGSGKTKPIGWLVFVPRGGMLHYSNIPSFRYSMPPGGEPSVQNKANWRRPLVMISTFGKKAYAGEAGLACRGNKVNLPGWGNSGGLRGLPGSYCAKQSQFRSGARGSRPRHAAKRAVRWFFMAPPVFSWVLWYYGQVDSLRTVGPIGDRPRWPVAPISCRGRCAGSSRRW